MPRRATARNTWIGDYMRAHGPDLGAASAAYKRAHGGGGQVTRTRAGGEPSGLSVVRQNPGGGIGLGTIALGGVVAYALVPGFRTWVGGMLGKLGPATAAPG